MTYTSHIPTLDTSHVKASSTYNNYYPHQAASSTNILYSGDENGWDGGLYAPNLQQRFHIDLGEGHIIRRIYYNNYHTVGGYTARGIKYFTFWGSDSADSFNEVTYTTDTGWTQIGETYQLDQHVSADQADDKYLLIDNSTSYQYYALKISENYGDTVLTGVRRINLQTEDGYEPPASGQFLSTRMLLGVGN
jgi:hypothetical protein